MTREIPKEYQPQQIEEYWAQEWVRTGLYRAEESADGPVFCIVIPPPNVTGYIHIGHMLEHTQIDALTRWHRMLGHRTLWLPGMDHAGISTQVVVERELAKEGLTRVGIGREEFEKRAWEWKAHSGGTIKKQMIRLGESCDWSREKFTLDPPMYRAVLEAFLRLYNEGLIYRGRYIVNWCPRCLTALSDLETPREERNGHLWYFKYPIVGSDRFIVVATTRPETMLGDTAVAVNPEDERYRDLIGKKVMLPLMNREIPVIADAAVDREFGTGAVKVTPAHDPNDFEMGKRHALPEIDVMTEDAHMNENAGAYKGLDRFEARKRVVADMEAARLLEKVENHKLSVGICQRCHTVIEPRISTQWFCKMKPLAEPASKAVTDGLIEIAPDNQRKIFLDWMANIRDWCISRQLWWGHRIPIWHCKGCGGMTPARNSDVKIVNGHAQAASPPEKCAKCGKGELVQDADVLDTWFSSGIFPLSTLGWPDETADLKKFYPTSLLISGYDILFFWDARMVMMCGHLARGTKAEARIPFRQLYLHSLVRDAQGQKMSKMRGNVVDPLEWLEKFGTDALRFTLAIKAAPGTDIALSEDAVMGYRAFANKIWNAARFLFLNLEKYEASGGERLEQLASPEARQAAPHRVGQGELPLIDRWIFSRLAEVAPAVSASLEDFKFHEAAYDVYHFFWGDFCDWYIEWTKSRLQSSDREVARAAWQNIFAVFEAALRLLHPFMPFLTEELWHRLPQVAGAKSISLARFPTPPGEWIDARADEEMKALQELIVAARNVRAELKIDPKKAVPAEFYCENPLRRELVQANLAAILQLMPLSALEIVPKRYLAAGAVKGGVRSTAEYDLRIPYEEQIDAKAEIARGRKEIDRLQKDIDSKQRQLGDETFKVKAPAHIVENMRVSMVQRQLELKKLQDRIRQLEGGSATA
jgi:valyl-tRNA synthetase